MRQYRFFAAARLLGVFTFVIEATPARAIDCAKATTVDEKAICADPGLKAKDAALSRLYFNTLRGLRGERRDLLIADQRRWLSDKRHGGCRADATSTAFVDCLSGNLAARSRAITVCFAGAPASATDMCSVYDHAACPDATASLSGRLLAYPWLVEMLIGETKAAIKQFDCSPESAATPGSPDQNEANSTETLMGERPGLISIRREDDEMSRNAMHPLHGERIVTYDTRTRTEVPITAVLPALKAGSPLLRAISGAADAKLNVPCCGDSIDPTFSGLGLRDEPMPSGWATSTAGDLVVGYDYNTLDRSFVATATIPRAVFLQAVAPNYAAAFAKTPTTEVAAP